MVKGIQTSGAAMRPAMLAQAILAHNLANANTDGFRQDRIAFARPASASREPVAGESPSGAPELRAALDTSPGPYQVTQEPLDLALQGDGYFVVATPEGERYTRVGHFRMSTEGTLVTPQGFPVLGSGGPLTLPRAGGLRVTANGEIRDEQQVFGQVRVVRFEAEQEAPLRRAGAGLYASSAEPVEAEGVRVLQGVLEGPNVQPLQALVEMVTLLRHFEMNEKALRAQDESLGRLIESARA
ncbi:MAG: flagellar hook basal-body protein [Candidatus Eisenbacteria bacterium]|uniref:Flagellar hook basal-body protein n=1 Tax=Eiseniibacteriota bacterium TaxID=2212470 RepID=A0A937X8D5_UNCEI|nr:flagellar hook basal-body protein [Candidatus Eisenbacteria bacterium]